MRKMLGCVGGLLVSAVATAHLAPGEYQMQSIASPSFHQLVESVHSQYGNDMLLVFDDDNTLETTDKPDYGYLGGVAWFDWQAGLLKDQPHSTDLVAHSYAELLQVQQYLFERIAMIPTEDGLVDEVSRFEMAGVPTVVETARGPEMAGPTYRELQRSHFHFNFSSNRYLAPFIPTAQYCGVTASGRRASYAQGVYYTSGQNKGLMLTCLLNKFKQQPKAVVFVDDTQRNDDNVWQYYKRYHPGVAVYAVHDLHQQATVAGFDQHQKQLASQRWASMRAAYQRWRHSVD